MQFPFRPKNLSEIISIFGDPKIHYDTHGQIHISNEWETKNLVLINTPLPLPKRVYCHRLFAEPLSESFQEIADLGLQHLIYTWDGCFNPRFVRGSLTVPSSHTFAVSIDVNASRNPMGTAKNNNVSWETNTHPQKMDRRLIDIFLKNGMCWGNDFKRHDSMHFSLIWW